MAGCNQFAGLCFDCLSADRDKHRLHADTDTQYLACQLLRIPVHGLPVSAFLPVCRFAPLTFLIAISQLFSSYESPYPAGSIFHAFFFIGLGSLLFPQLLYFVPLFYLGMISFRSLSLKSFFAGLTGLCVPYWLFFGYAFYYDKMNLFYHPLQELIHFQTHQLWDIRDGQNHILWNHHLDITGQQRALFPCFLFRQGTHAYIPFFLIAVEAWIYLLGILQPQHFDILLQMQVIVGSILTGHLFTLTHNRFTGIFSSLHLFY